MNIDYIQDKINDQREKLLKHKLYSNIETIKKYLLQSGFQKPIPISEETGINESTVRVVLSRGIKEGIFVKNGSMYGVST